MPVSDAQKTVDGYPRSIFITGASSGIGRALAQSYAAPGVTLFLCGRNGDRLQISADACRKQGAEVYTYLFDVTDAASSERAIKKAWDINPFDLVIANAGVSAGVLGGTESSSRSRTIFETNVFGVVNTVLPAVDLMKKRRSGQIAIISSIAAYRGMSSCPAYSASKACVKAWGEALHGVLKAEGVDVSVVCPGFVETPLTDKNKFYMPFLMKASKAADIIKKRLVKRPAIIAFPFVMVFGAWLGSFLPSRIARPIMGLLPRKEK